MTDYDAISKDLEKRFYRAFGKLYVSELKDQLAEKDEIITANDHVIAEQKVEIERLRTALRELVGAVADATSQKSIPLALREARSVLENK